MATEWLEILPRSADGLESAVYCRHLPAAFVLLCRRAGGLSGHAYAVAAPALGLV